MNIKIFSSSPHIFSPAFTYICGRCIGFDLRIAKKIIGLRYRRPAWICLQQSIFPIRCKLKRLGTVHKLCDKTMEELKVDHKWFGDFLTFTIFTQVEPIPEWSENSCEKLDLKVLKPISLFIQENLIKKTFIFGI